MSTNTCAACAEKDVEIARLKYAFYNEEAKREAADAEIAREAELCEVAIKQRDRWKDRANDAEARLAAMATVTGADIKAALSAKPEEWQEGVQYIIIRGLSAMDCEMAISASEDIMEAALEAFVVNKTVGGT